MHEAIASAASYDREDALTEGLHSSPTASLTETEGHHTLEGRYLYVTTSSDPGHLDFLAQLLHAWTGLSAVKYGGTKEDKKICADTEFRYGRSLAADCHNTRANSRCFECARYLLDDRRSGFKASFVILSYADLEKDSHLFLPVEWTVR